MNVHNSLLPKVLICSWLNLSCGVYKYRELTGQAVISLKCLAITLLKTKTIKKKKKNYIENLVGIKSRC
jgi:hypothetical protein